MNFLSLKNSLFWQKKVGHLRQAMFAHL